MTATLLYTAAQMQQMDQQLAALRKVPSYQLMFDAASAAKRVLRANWPEARSVVIVTGGGNNGGDGWLLSALLQGSDYQVRVCAMADPEQLRGDAAKAYAAACAQDVTWIAGWQAGADAAIAQLLQQADVLVDALLGTGLRGALRAPISALVTAMNDSHKPVLAVDIPTGLQSDSGVVAGVAIRASVTITFVGGKRGQFSADGPDHCGRLVLDDLGWREHAADADQRPADEQTGTVRLADTELLRCLPVRQANSHKNVYGRVLVLAGQPGMAGAGLLSAAAALRSGGGLVVLATSAEHAAMLHTSQPELMITAVDAQAAADQALQQQLHAADCVVFGPGIGRGDWAQQCWRAVLAAADQRPGGLSVVVDADGLYWLQQQPDSARKLELTITPHPGEAAMLLDCSSQTVQQERFVAAAELARRYQAVTVLKGNGSLVADPAAGLWLCPHGHPGMATAGSGDVLSGICAALLAHRRAAVSGADKTRLVATAVLAHALAGEQALRMQSPPGASSTAYAGMIASDIIAGLPGVLP